MTSKSNTTTLSLRDALSLAFNYGQTYWSQADSDSYAQQDKAEVTKEKFQAFADEVTHKFASDLTAAKESESKAFYDAGMVDAVLQIRTDELDSAIEELNHVARWQPIETAPKGAKGIAWMRLAWGEGEDQCTGDGYRQGDQFFACAWFYQLGQPKQFAARDVLVNPTHWMSHAAPPLATKVSA